MRRMLHFLVPQTNAPNHYPCTFLLQSHVGRHDTGNMTPCTSPRLPCSNRAGTFPRTAMASITSEVTGATELYDSPTCSPQSTPRSLRNQSQQDYGIDSPNEQGNFGMFLTCPFSSTCLVFPSCCTKFSSDT